MKKFPYIIKVMLLIGLMSLSCSDEGQILAGIQNGEELSEGTPLPFSLEQNYPNPFNPTTLIRFGLALEMHARIKVWTEDWQAVQTLVNRNLTVGFHAVQFSATDIPSGEYYYTMEAKGVTLIRKMKVVKQFSCPSNFLSPNATCARSGRLNSSR